MNYFNGLTPAELERLSILMEECGEVIQVVGKIQRHGFKSQHPLGGPDNRELLEIECGHVRQAMIMLCDKGDLSKTKIHESADAKKISIRSYLHHND